MDVLSLERLMVLHKSAFMFVQTLCKHTFTVCVGMTAEEFVSRSKLSGSADGGSSKYGRSRYQLLQETVASWLDVAVDNVDVFTVLNHPFDERTIDVRYSAHGSPYYRPAKLNGLMTKYRSQVSFGL